MALSPHSPEALQVTEDDKRAADALEAAVDSYLHGRRTEAVDVPLPEAVPFPVRGELARRYREAGWATASVTEASGRLVLHLAP